MSLGGSPEHGRLVHQHPAPWQSHAVDYREMHENTVLRDLVHVFPGHLNIIDPHRPSSRFDFLDGQWPVSCLQSLAAIQFAHFNEF